MFSIPHHTRQDRSSTPVTPQGDTPTRPRVQRYQWLWRSAMLLVLCAGWSGLSGCQILEGSGKMVTIHEKIENFTSLNIGSTFQVTLKPGEKFDVSLTIDDNLRAFLDVFIKDGTLHVRLINGVIYQNVNLSATITMPTLQNLHVGGASKVIVDGIACKGEMEISASGASHIDWKGYLSLTGLKLTASGASKVTFDDLKVDGPFEGTFSGASQVSLKGTGQDAKIRASGASRLSLLPFVVFAMDLKASGASKAELHVLKTMSIDASGASQISYLGSPLLEKSELSGASKLEQYKE